MRSIWLADPLPRSRETCLFRSRRVFIDDPSLVSARAKYCKPTGGCPRTHLGQVLFPHTSTCTPTDTMERSCELWLLGDSRRNRCGCGRLFSTSVGSRSSGVPVKSHLDKLRLPLAVPTCRHSPRRVTRTSTALLPSGCSTQKGASTARRQPAPGSCLLCGSWSPARPRREISAGRDNTERSWNFTCLALDGTSHITS